ncbi:DUF2628 domain-containing protein [Salipaludibacillus sp. CF4.18]|uniref:DUF2628 domain-containing protein n=1 Tax=Salipaludibacillus sp. CF4.18 TaxID=3373081 RepID=UPI003EE58298
MNKDQSSSYLTTQSPPIYEIVKNNHEYYDKKWKKHKKPNNYAGWNWPAFIIPPFWLAYRYMYGWTLLYFIFIVAELTLLSAISFYSEITFLLPILTHFFFGLKGNAFFTRRVLKLIQLTNSDTEKTKPAVPLFAKKGTSWISAIVTPVIVIFLLILPVQALSEWSFESELDPGIYIYSDNNNNEKTPEYNGDIVTSPVFKKYDARINLFYIGEEPVNNQTFRVSLLFQDPEEPDEWESLRDRESKKFSSNRISLDVIDAQNPATKVGNYRVEIFVGGEFVGEERFTITME